MEKHMVWGRLSQIQFLVLFIWLLYDVVDFASHVCNRLVHIGYAISLLLTGFPQALEIMENLENHKKSSMRGKIMEFEKP